jgi:tRNA(Ile)-lysidine synthase
MLPSAQHSERFRRDLEALAGTPARLGLAVSGGPDSMALLLLAAAAFPGRVQAATVDHKLRQESMIEALHVEDICGRIGCPHAILEVTVPDGPGGLQAEARTARYEALSRWASAEGLDQLATAHHADDQAETVLMRLGRGSGVAGLAGIRPVRHEAELLLVRPLLGWRKSELVHIVSQAGIAYVEDPSNRDERFDRTAVRRFLAENPAVQPHRLARTAAAMREADEGLSWAAERLWPERCTLTESECRIDPRGLPRELRRRLLKRAIRALRDVHDLRPAWSGAEDVDRLLAALEKGETATRAGLIATAGTTWRLRLAPARRPVHSKRPLPDC